MSAQKPSIGRIVLVPMNPRDNNGASVAPAIITRVWNDTTINVRVLADAHGDVTHDWRTSLTHEDALAEGASPLHYWCWPPRV